MEPVVRRQDVIVQEVDRQTMLFDSATAEFHLLNEVAAFVFRHADGRATPAEILQLARTELDPELELPEIEAAVAELDRVNLLQRQPGASARPMPRREAVRRLGVSAAVVLPFVTSMVAPPPAKALSGNGSPSDGEDGTDKKDKKDKKEKF